MGFQRTMRAFVLGLICTASDCAGPFASLVPQAAAALGNAFPDPLLEAGAHSWVVWWRGALPCVKLSGTDPCSLVERGSVLAWISEVEIGGGNQLSTCSAETRSNFRVGQTRLDPDYQRQSQWHEQQSGNRTRKETCLYWSARGVQLCGHHKTA